MIEADFAREYGMDLTAELAAGLSWRRFRVLLAGLSASSRWMLAAASETPPGPLLSGAAVDAFMRKMGGR